MPKQTEPEPLAMWVVFWNTTDYPAQYVARKFLAVEGEAVPTLEAITSGWVGQNSLDFLHREMSQRGVLEGRVSLPLMPGQLPTVVEMWV